MDTPIAGLVYLIYLLKMVFFFVPVYTAVSV